MGLAAVTGDRDTPQPGSLPYTHRVAYYAASWYVRKLAGEGFMFFLPRIFAPFPSQVERTTSTVPLSYGKQSVTISEGPSWATLNAVYGVVENVSFQPPFWEISVGSLLYTLPPWVFDLEHHTADRAPVEPWGTVLFPVPSVDDVGMQLVPATARRSLRARLAGWLHPGSTPNSAFRG